MSDENSINENNEIPEEDNNAAANESDVNSGVNDDVNGSASDDALNNSNAANDNASGNVPPINYIAIPPSALVNFNLIFANSGDGQQGYVVEEEHIPGNFRQIIATHSAPHDFAQNHFTSPHELTEFDENYIEYFRRQLEGVNSVDDALGEIDTGYDFTDE